MKQVIVIIAAIALLASQIWLIVLAFKRSGLLWAVLIAFFSLIAGLAFCITKKEGWLPWALNLAAWLCVVAVYRNWI
jgi:hypothetical protein